MLSCHMAAGRGDHMIELKQISLYENQIGNV